MKGGLSAGAEEVKDAFEAMCQVNNEIKSRKAEHIALLLRWEVLNARSRNSMSGGVRPEISAVLGEKEAQKLFGETEEQKRSKTVQNAFIHHRTKELETSQEELNETFRAAVKDLYEAIARHQKEFPDLWKAFQNFRDQGGVANYDAGDTFLISVNKWMEKLTGKALDCNCNADHVVRCQWCQRQLGLGCKACGFADQAYHRLEGKIAIDAGLPYCCAQCYVPRAGAFKIIESWPKEM